MSYMYMRVCSEREGTGTHYKENAEFGCFSVDDLVKTCE